MSSGCDVLLHGGVVGVVGGPFLELAVVEGGTGPDEGCEMGCVDFAPPVLGGVEEFVGHRERGLAGSGASGDPGAEPDSGERRLDRVSGP